MRIYQNPNGRFKVDMRSMQKQGLYHKAWEVKDALGKPFHTRDAALRWCKYYEKEKQRQLFNGGKLNFKSFTFHDAYRLLVDKEESRTDVVPRSKATNLTLIANTLAKLRIEKKKRRLLDVRLSEFNLDMMEREIIPALRLLKKVQSISAAQRGDVGEVYGQSSLRRAWFYILKAQDLAVEHQMMLSAVGRTLSFESKKKDENFDNHTVRKDDYNLLRQRLPEYEKLFSELFPDVLFAFQVAYLAGLRRGELMALKPSDVGWNQGWLQIERSFRNQDDKIGWVLSYPKGGTDKNPKTRVVPIDGPLTKLFREHILKTKGLSTNSDDFLFQVGDNPKLGNYRNGTAFTLCRGKPWNWNDCWREVQLRFHNLSLQRYRKGPKEQNPEWFELWDTQTNTRKHTRISRHKTVPISGTIRHCLSLCGFKVHTWHELRHLFASACFSAGENNRPLPLSTIMEYMGHDNAQMTKQVYREWLSPTSHATDGARIAAALSGR